MILRKASLIVVSCVAASIVPVAKPAELTFEGARQHPTVSITPEDVVRAKQRIQSDPQAKAWLDSVKNSFAPWADKDAAWVKSVMPGKSACFAYGFTGCPICGSRWSAWGAAPCSFDKPGHVTCSKGHLLPDADHPDTGTGYVGKDKRIHYFVGSYNAWAVETLLYKLALPAADLYLLTGDERAGAMAGTILDEMASIYPSCDKGSWDYPSNPPSGRLDRPWYQVARVLVHFVETYDRIYSWPGMDEPSATPGLTRRQNIERNLLLNGAAYCYEQSIKTGGLHNGEADYLRGVLAVGVCLGIPEYVKWPVDGPNGIRTMLANNVDRDGAYFETSTGYGLHTRNLYVTFAEPLVNYRGSAYPDGLNLWDDPRFQAFYVLPQMAQNCQGHDLPYGDDAPVTKPSVSPYIAPTIWDCSFSEYLANRVSDPKQREQYAALNARLRILDSDADSKMTGMVAWRLFHAANAPTSQPADVQLEGRLERLLNGSFFFGHKGIAVMRQGSRQRSHAAALRFGPSLVHGHRDDLNVNYFANGWELTYDQGYSLGSTHTQVGWAHQTASHNVVVVDEKSQGGGMLGGSLLHFADLPGLKLTEASSTAYAHAGVSVYRRLFAMTEDYALDLFRVKGGKQHDLPMHSISTDVTYTGVEFGSPRPGSLAGEKYEWGNLQLNDGDMKGYPNKPYWNPPPGNGYGFLVQPAEANPSGDWSATWTLSDGTAFRMFSLAHGGPVVTAIAPGLYPTYPSARHVIRRHAGENLSSCFASVWQAAAKGKPATVQSIRRIDEGKDLDAQSSLAITVSLRNGERDIWLLGPNPDSHVEGHEGDLSIAFEGSIARVRMRGSELVSAWVLDGRLLKIGDWSVELGSPRRSARVIANAAGSAEIQIDADWPGDGKYAHQPVYFESERYSRNTAYTLAEVQGRSLRVEQVDTLLGQGVVDKIVDANTLTTRIPHEYARGVRSKSPTGFFTGKLLRSTDGASTRIRSIEFADPMVVKVDSTAGFQPGEKFLYQDVQPADTVTVQHYATLTRTDAKTYRCESNTETKVTAPNGIDVQRK